jgi:6-pyruvoyltetrahydropterin/6-carboxytetrahydropterin synthase
MKNPYLTLTVNTHFDAAHHLLNYVGACANLHGHRWNVEIKLRGLKDINTGMVFDFKNIKSIINDLDHKCLNDIITQPTAENIAFYLYEQFRKIAHNIDAVHIKLWETPDCCVEVGDEI